jgi:hypothetical protein
MQKSYADSKITPREFNIGYYVYIRVRTKKSSLSLGMHTKLVATYFGPFEVLSQIGPIA